MFGNAVGLWVGMETGSSGMGGIGCVNVLPPPIDRAAALRLRDSWPCSRCGHVVRAANAGDLRKAANAHVSEVHAV